MKQHQDIGTPMAADQIRVHQAAKSGEVSRRSGINAAEMANLVAEHQGSFSRNLLKFACGTVALLGNCVSTGLKSV